MHTHTALSVLAHGRTDVVFRCESCGHVCREPIALLVRRFGPLFPLAALADHAYCQKCGSLNLSVLTA